jgi:hypothetical protein
MKLVSKMAVALALAAGVSGIALEPALAQKKGKESAPAAFSPKLSKEFRAAAQPVQKAIEAKDFATARAALPTLTTAATAADDKFYLGQFKLQIGLGLQDKALQKEAINDVLNSGSAGAAAETGKFAFFAGQFAYQDKDYATAVQRLTQARDSGYQPKDANGQPTRDIDLMLAEANFRSNRTAEGLAGLEAAITAEKAAGRKAPADWYQRAASVAYQSKMMPEVAKWTRMQIVDYPTAENWRSALVIYSDSQKMDDQTNLDLMRLQRAAGALSGERDYFEYALLADKVGLPGEAKAVVDEGLAKGSFNKSSKAINEIGTLAGSRVAGDKASLPAAEKSAASAANGKIALSTADAYFGYGDYAKAAELYRLAIQKGGVDANIANLRLGMALARSGQKDAARQAFGQVQAGQRAEIAKFWTLWLDQQA